MSQAWRINNTGPSRWIAMGIWAAATVVPVVALGQAPAAEAKAPAKSTRPWAGPSYQAFAMAHQGDASRGKELFFDDRRLGCSRCHTVDAKGGKAGPDLFAVGDKFGRRDIVESILTPSANIAVGYSTTIVETKAGAVYDGVLKEASPDGVGLMGMDGRLVRVAAADIRRRRTTDVSLMPQGLHTALTVQEFADLVEYLASLKVPDTAAASRAGMPGVIPELPTPMSLRPIHKPEHQFVHPVWFGPVPGVAGAFAVVEHESGRIWILREGPPQEKSPFLDTGKFMTGTRGLLGMVFHPGYAANRRYFFVKHFNEDGHFVTILFEGEAAPDLLRDSGRPLKPLLRLQESSNVHYGGGLQFGPDGFLYVGMGDSGPQGDPNGNAQNMSLLLGKMLRLDVDHAEGGKPYAVPTDNPFVSRPGVRPEIWAAGLREPWRFSFDAVTHDLWAGDVGQDLFEEVDVIRKGANYGWNVYEGFEPYSNKRRRDGKIYVPPVFAYGRKYGVSVTGGYVYRADPASSFYGVYVFADYESRRIFGLTAEDGVLKKVRQIGRSPQRVVSFGCDERGAMYLVGYEGTLYQMDFTGSRFE
jgi:putative heme-binding domain-containing protein